MDRAPDVCYFATMPPTRYQVFVSSTFDDLEKTRLKAILGVMRIRQFPVGMEVLTAMDERGWGSIRKLIETSDYYVVIVGGRYGSVDEETGISWTEREYDYAGERGVKRLAFIQKESGFTGDKMDRDADSATRFQKQELLSKFKRKLECAHHRVLWETPDELVGMIQSSLTNLMNDDRESGELPPGWVRGGETPIGIAQELARLSEENRALREENASLRDRRTVHLEILALGDGDVPIKEHVLVETEESNPYGIAASPGRPSIEDIEEYLDKKNRALWVRLAIENKGTIAARDVEVRLEIAPALHLLGIIVATRNGPDSWQSCLSPTQRYWIGCIARARAPARRRSNSAFPEPRSVRGSSVLVTSSAPP